MVQTRSMVSSNTRSRALARRVPRTVARVPRPLAPYRSNRSVSQNALRYAAMAGATGLRLAGRPFVAKAVSFAANKLSRYLKKRTAVKPRVSMVTRPSFQIAGSTGRSVSSGRVVTTSDPMKVSVKGERGWQHGAYNSVYVGGTTHPCYLTLRVIAMSILRFMMVKANISFANFKNFITMPAVGGSAFDVRVWTRQVTPTLGALTTNAITSNGKTFQELADDLATLLISNLTTTGSRRLVAIGLTQQTTTVPTISSQYYLAEDIYITVKGESGLQVQNRTNAETSDVSGRENSDSIYNNPLRGKYYTFRSSRPILRDPENLTATQNDTMQYGSQFGDIRTGDRESAILTDWNNAVENTLQKPPPGNTFSNCATTKYMGVKPGEIVKSKVQHTVRMNLALWMDKFSSKFETAAVKTLAGLLTDRDPFDWRVGKSHIFGLEKTCDTSSTTSQEVTVGLEVNLFMVAKMDHRRKFSTLPLVMLA